MIWIDFKGLLHMVQPKSASDNILTPITLLEKYLSFTTPNTHPLQMDIKTIRFEIVNPVNFRVPKTVRHGTSLHRICPKLLIDLSPSRLESIDSSPSRLKSQTSARRPIAKLFGSIHIQLESQVSVCWPTLKLIGSSHRWLESSASVCRLLLKLFSRVQGACPLTDVEPVDSHPDRLSLGRLNY